MGIIKKVFLPNKQGYMYTGVNKTEFNSADTHLSGQLVGSSGWALRVQWIETWLFLIT
jgi:hypothetical protein